MPLGGAIEVDKVEVACFQLVVLERCFSILHDDGDDEIILGGDYWESEASP